MELKELKLNGEAAVLNTHWENAVHIASRKTFFCQVALFQLGSLYIEVFYRPRKKEIARIRTFRSASELKPYLKQINVKGIFQAERTCPR